MAGDADATRARILAAAIEEFAAYGIAGARVDRIAEAAKANKSLIYRYFHSKDRLFDAAFAKIVTEKVLTIPIDTDDLVEYAGRMYDTHTRNPEVARLAAWHRLERDRPGHESVAEIVVSYKAKIEAIAQAQKAGKVPTHRTAADILAIVAAVPIMWNSVGAEYDTVVPKRSHRHRRKVVTETVRAFLEP